jgi:TatD DNase family protein
MNKYFDSHCHLNMMEDSKMIMEKCESLNINYCIVGTDLETSSKINKDYSSYSSSFIYSLGIHPEYADEVDRIEELDKMLESSSCKAVGECGLDYFFNKENKEKQKKLFITQIKLAIKYKLPLIIHCRDAYEDLYEILKTYHTKLSNILIHCFDTTFD